MPEQRSKFKSKLFANTETQYLNKEETAVAKIAKKKAKAKAPVVMKTDNASPKNTKPTLIIAKELQQAFDHYNKALFQNKLGPIIIRVQTLKKAKGYFKRNAWGNGKGEDHTAEIVLDPILFRERKLEETLSTLVHEMVHQKDYEEGTAPKRPYHGKSWCEMMKAIDLTPVIKNAKGQVIDKPTGPNATHEIVKGGKFDLATKPLLDTGFQLSWSMMPAPPKPEKGKKKKAGGRFVYEAECGSKVWGKSGLKMNCQCGCESVFEQIDKPDEGDEDGEDD